MLRTACSQRTAGLATKAGHPPRSRTGRATTATASAQRPSGASSTWLWGRDCAAQGCGDVGRCFGESLLRCWAACCTALLACHSQARARVNEWCAAVLRARAKEQAQLWQGSSCFWLQAPHLCRQTKAAPATAWCQLTGPSQRRTCTLPAQCPPATAAVPASFGACPAAGCQPTTPCRDAAAAPLWGLLCALAGCYAERPGWCLTDSLVEKPSERVWDHTQRL